MDKISRFQSVIDAVAKSDRYEGRGRGQAKPRSFVTISREAGAGGHTIQERLVEELRRRDPGEPPWSGFDKELVEMAAGQDELFKPMVESLGEETSSWLDDLFSIFKSDSRATEFTAYKRTAQTIRALAQVGRTIIVGRGGVFITRDMPGGLHIHLVAPMEARVEHMAEQKGISRDEAEDEVRRIDSARETFYKRYWPNARLGPETYTVTYNTAAVEDDAIVDSVIPLIPGVGEHRPLKSRVQVAIAQ